MRSFKTNLLAGASALLVAAAFSVPASAQVVVDGSGSSLLAPYWAHAMACYVDPANVSNPAQPTDHATLYTLAPPNPQVTINTADCGAGPFANETDIVQDVSSSSGNGLAGVYSRDITQYGAFPGTAVGFSDANIVYGLSDIALAQSDVDVWNFGTGNGSPVTPAAFQGLTFKNSGNTGSGSNPNPKDTYGALIQVPASIDPVALAYKGDYKNNNTVFTLNVQSANHVLNLTQNLYCRVANGLLTDWNQLTGPELATVNGSTGGVANSLQDPSDHNSFSAPIHLVGRSGNSGTTFIYTRHLANACSGLTGNKFTAASQALPSLSPNPGSYTLEGSSGAVAAQIDADPGSIGYIGADFVLPFNTYTNATGVTLHAAALQNANLDFVEPSGAAASIPYQSLTPPSTSLAQADPLNWVPVVVNPSDAGAYPMTGTTNIVLSQHYDANTVNTLTAAFNPLDGSEGLLTWYFDTTNNPVVNDPTTGILSQSGLAPLPSNWASAITNTFLGGSGSLAITP